MGKVRLDKLLVKRQLAASRERARALIVAGQVEVGGIVVAKAGAQVVDTARVTLRKEDHPYVSRGALKLVQGLRAFAIDPAGATALDVGASTGGFTDVLLRRGAARVYAVDVGYGQLAWSLRQDARVVVLERENIRHLDPGKIPEPCDLAVIDVSFISLTKVLDKVAALMRGPCTDGESERDAGRDADRDADRDRRHIVALVKPQFEAGRAQVGKGGVVRDPAVRMGTVERIRAFAASRGFRIGEHVESPIRGPAGNVEFLLHLRPPSVAPDDEPGDEPDDTANEPA